GMERLLLVLEAAAQADAQGVAARLTAAVAPDVYVVNRGDAAERSALALARDLRASGLRVELDASGSAFGKQFKRADRSGAPWALVIGEDEAERGEVRLKALKQQAEESTVALAPVSAIVERLLTP
ncbi:MAG: His/Gly/Thr/Pro-type tRNA ligase C-terminal domain-containing protein, partial [Synechococcus sp.]